MSRTRVFDPALYLDSAAVRLAWLQAAFETGDVTDIVEALAAAARAAGAVTIARRAGMSRENLQKLLRGDGNPDLASLLRVLHALGVRLAVAPGE